MNADLRYALDLVLLYPETDSAKFEPAAVRWLSRYALEARDLGIAYIGSCCGSVASHVREMAMALGKLPQTDQEIEWRVDYSKPMSAYEYYRHEA